MAKIGRNDKCPCQSGKKYKHCCARKVSVAQTKPLTPEQAARITLMSGVKAIQEKAITREAVSREIGVFFFYSTAAGDAWLLEMTDCDCVQLARGGERLEPPIDENPETIEVNWSHQFKIVNKQLELTSYLDKSVTVMADAPAQAIHAMLRRIRKKFSPQQLEKVHVREAETSGS
jgi:SEC-C motif